MNQINFGSFLKRNQTYKSIYDGFDKLFNLLFVSALDYRHQIDLHLNQGPSSLLDEKKQQLFSCMEDILSRIEEPYAAEVQAAFDAFKKQHGNDKPVHAPVEFQQLLESFLEFVKKQTKTPPPQEQPNLFVVPSFLSHIYQITSLGISLDVRRNQIIFSDSRLSLQDKSDLIRLLFRLEKDSDNFFLKVDARDNLQNQGLGQTGMISLVDEYKKAIMGAYAVYMGKLYLAHGPSADR